MSKERNEYHMKSNLNDLSIVILEQKLDEILDKESNDDKEMNKNDSEKIDKLNKKLDELEEKEKKRRLKKRRLIRAAAAAGAGLYLLRSATRERPM